MYKFVAEASVRLRYLLDFPKNFLRHLSWKLLIYSLADLNYMQIVINGGEKNEKSDTKRQTECFTSSSPTPSPHPVGKRDVFVCVLSAELNCVLVLVAVETTYRRHTGSYALSYLNVSLLLYAV